MFRIDYIPGTNSPKYGKPVTVRETYLDGEYAVAMEHYEIGICLFIFGFKCQNSVVLIIFLFRNRVYTTICNFKRKYMWIGFAYNASCMDF